MTGTDMPTTLVIAAAFGYLLALFALAAWADKRAAAGRSVIGNAWVYALSLGVYCSAWTYFGSVGRAADGGLGFLPIYLGPILLLLFVTALHGLVQRRGGAGADWSRLAVAAGATLSVRLRAKSTGSARARGSTRVSPAGTKTTYR